MTIMNSKNGNAGILKEAKMYLTPRKERNRTGQDVQTLKVSGQINVPRQIFQNCPVLTCIELNEYECGNFVC